MFKIPTLDETHAFLIALHKRHFPDIDVSEMSDDWLWLRTLAGAVTDNNAHIAATKNDLMPDTATGDTQVRWGDIRGVKKKGATPARKAFAFRVFGTAAADVPDAIALRHNSGLRYKTVGATVVGADGYVDVGIVAVDVGSQTRLNAGERLTFDTPVVDLEEEGELQLDLDEDGEDAESEAAYGARILSRFSSPPLGGAQEDYVQWALAEVGIAAAYAYPLRWGNGTVHLAALHAGSGDARILVAPEVAELEAIINTKRPVAMKKGFSFKVLQVESEPTDVEFRLVPNGEPQYEPDWLDGGGVAAHGATPWTAGTRKLQLAADRPATMKAGDRIVISNGATGKERVIEALDGTDAVILEPDADGDIPDAASVIYSGGPLVQPTRAAILALIDGLGTANPDATRYGSWEGSLRPTSINRVATAVAGVLDGELVTPVAIVEAADPGYPDAEVGLITPGQILVRYKP